jgi:hypothetical protein
MSESLSESEQSRGVLFWFGLSRAQWAANHTAMTEFARVIEDTRIRREEARALLGALHTARDRAAALTDGSGIDAYKEVTGASSLERAIDRTKRLIASFDRVIDELSEDLSDEDLRLLAEIETERVGAASEAAS